MNYLRVDASRWIICLSLRPRQISDLRDTDKSRYFAITELNNCCIIQSRSLFSYFNHLLGAQGSDLPFFFRERCSNYAWAEYYLHQNTFRRYYAWADHYICRQLFAGHMVGSRPMERREKMHRMIIIFICTVQNSTANSFQMHLTIKEQYITSI